MEGTELIAAERERQVAEEGYDADHDDRHGAQEMAWAAVVYAAPDVVLGWSGGGNPKRTIIPSLREPVPPFNAGYGGRAWELDRMPRPVNPNDLGRDDPADLEAHPEDANFSLTMGDGHPSREVRDRRVRELVKAGALIAAEIDRILRADA